MKKLIYIIVSGLLLSACSTSNSTSKNNKEITFYIVRHGKTMLNTVDRSQGWIDAPLTPAGVEVTESLGRGLHLADINFDLVYTSDSGRAIETAEIILNQNGQEKMIPNIHKDARLREFNFGTFEGMYNEEMWEVVAHENGQTLEEWTKALQTDGFLASIKGFADTLSRLDNAKVEPGVNWPAESYQTVIDRSTASLTDIVEAAQKEGANDVLIVSHGMTIASLVASLDQNAVIPASGLKNASVCIVKYKDGVYTVEVVNDLSYVDAGSVAK